jgi:hypothetical protein
MGKSAQKAEVQWIGLLGNILTGFTMVFTFKFLGVSGSNFPIIQFYERFAIGIFQRIFQKPEPISRRRQRAEFSFAPCAEE